MIPHRRDYKIGERILVEGIITGWEWGQPYGAVEVTFPASTDPSHMLDGVTAIVPQALIHDPPVTVSDY